MIMISSRTAYPSDLSDEDWERIADCLPNDKHRGRNRSTDLRDVVNAIHYRQATSCSWRMLPHDFPAWATVYTYFRQWESDGTLTRIKHALRGQETGATEEKSVETDNPEPDCAQDETSAEL